jgi:tetratricopeptide (TPR) repeat protein
MNRSLRLLALAAVCLIMFAAVGCNKLKARDQLNKGVLAYKAGKYEEAIERFKNAVAYDPNLLNAQLYLATAYAQQYVPGAETAENTRFAEQAIAEFKKVLDKNPGTEQKIGSLKGIASLYFNMKQMEPAKDYYRKVAELDPNDPEVYYSIAVIDWTQTYQPRMEEKAKLGLKPDEPIKDKKVCAQLKAANEPKVEEGMQMLQKAIELRPQYDDAMAYLNLMYREKADIQCGDPAGRAAALKEADNWVDRTMAVKKAKAEKAAAPGGIVAEQPKAQ